MNSYGARLLALLSAAGDHSPRRLCTTCVEVLPVERAAISRAGPSGFEVLCASNESAAQIEAVQSTVGEGPGIEAIRLGGPVLVPDLSKVDPRWPLFYGALYPDAAGSMFAFPLQLGAVTLGVLDLYRDDTLSLTKAEFAGAVDVAEAVTSTLLFSVGSSDSEGSAGPWWMSSIASMEIHQATGMVLAQLGVSAQEAYVRLQARAFASERLLGEVAHDVVTRRLRFNRNGTGDGSVDLSGGDA